jgi:hypothetical protein
LNNVSGVSGSIGITGWALDDGGVTGIRILRDAAAGEAPGVKVFVGSGVFIPGARSDVAAAYPTYPNSARAGWGFLMLTNMLPIQGDGTYTFYIYADDANGNTTLLGTRTMTCNNSAAITPFGAIDTPGQGQSVSGLVNNFGWVLSRGARRADPPGGGTVRLLVDGVVIGSPAGWASRSDLSALFPVAQYSGVNTALGVAGFDSGTLSNGLHTIAWAVTDNQGAASGVGSRFFSVSNPTATIAPNPPPGLHTTSRLRAVGALEGRRGFDMDAPFRPYSPGSDGSVTIQAEELDRIELRLGASKGNLDTAGGLEPLPIGSHLDPATGVFTWQPGVGFVGTYNLRFETTDGLRDVRVHLNPKGSNRVGPQVVIDAPSSGDNVGQDFTLAGWAADLDSGTGTGIDVVHVWAYRQGASVPIFLGSAIVDGRRDDVGDVYGAQFVNSGYGMTIAALEPGVYDLAVFAWNVARGGFLPAKITTVVVR